MNRLFFAAALTISTTVGGHAMAQERVAKTGAVKPARTATHIAAPKTATSTKAAGPTKGTTAADPSLTVTKSTGAMDERTGGDLANVRGTSTSTSGSGAEEQHVNAVIVSATAAPRVIATPRLLRRMNADRVTIKLADDFHACYASAPAEKKADSAIVRVEVAPDGQIEGAKVESGAVASPAIAACIADASSHTTFGAPGGIGTIVLVQVRAR